MRLIKVVAGKDGDEVAVEEAFLNLEAMLESYGKDGKPMPEPAVFGMREVSVPMFAPVGSTGVFV